MIVHGEQFGVLVEEIVVVSFRLIRFESTIKLHLCLRLPHVDNCLLDGRQVTLKHRRIQSMNERFNNSKDFFQ